MEDNAPILRLVINDEISDGVDLISFVEDPAIEVNWVYFNSQKKTSQEVNLKTVSDDKRIVSGPALIPNKKIIRYDANNNPFYVYIDEPTIAKVAELFFKHSNHNVTRVNHEGSFQKGVTVFESWLIEDENNDKAVALGYEGLPKGTWMVSYKVENEELWNQIKNGEVLGFSIEGFFGQELVTQSKEASDIDEVYNKVSSIISSDLSDEDKYTELTKILKK